MKRSMSRGNDAGRQRWRHWLVVVALGVGAVALLARAVYLQVIDQEFLEKQATRASCAWRSSRRTAA